MQKSRLVLAAICALGSGLADAQQPPWYVGGSLGNARTSRELVTNRESTIVNFQSVNSEADLSDLGWKVFAGWQLNRYFGFEAFYTDLGKHTVHSNIVAAGNPPSTSTFDLSHKISGFGADMLVGSPIATPEFIVFGRVGAFASRLKADAAIAGNIFFTDGDSSDTHRSANHGETVFHWGVGGEWNFRRDMAVRLEWERFSKIGKPFEIGGTDTTGQADTDLASLGLVYRF